MQQKVIGKVTQKATRVDCPTCQTIIEWSERYPDRPFCSKRCKDRDFIDWANEEQRIAGSGSYDDIFSDSDINPQ